MTHLSKLITRSDLILLAAIAASPAAGASVLGKPDIVPEWYTLHRVHAQADLQLRSIGRFERFLTVPMQRAQDLGAEILVREIKSADETPLWAESAQGQDRREVAPVLLARMFASARAAGLRTIAYYWHMSDQRVLQRHPDWACRDHKGQLQAHRRRGVYLDITGPFKERVLRRLLQAARAGADGFYLDNMHLPVQGCWGSHSEVAYRQRFGEAAPPSPSRSSAYLRWLRFRATRIEQTLRYWANSIRAHYPQTVLLISARSLSALTTPEMTTRLASIAPAKTEYENALKPQVNGRVFNQNRGLMAPARDVRIAAGWAVLRDAGAPPHVWTPSVPNESHALGAVASIIVHGGIANVDVSDEVLLGEPVLPYGTPKAAIMAAFALGNRVSPFMARATPLRWAAVHFSEAQRNKRWPDFRRAWTDVLWPFIGSYGVLLRHKVPVAIVNDRQLARAEIGRYQVLVLPNPQALSPPQARALRGFRQRGGVVIEHESQWKWHVRKQNRAARQAFLDEVAPYLTRAPIRVTGGPQGLHATAFERVNNGSREWLVALTPKFSWVQVEYPDRPLRRDQVHAAPPPVRAGVMVELGTALTRGRHPSDFTAVEAISGRELEVATRHGRLAVSLPGFRHLALCVVRASRTSE